MLRVVDVDYIRDYELLERSVTEAKKGSIFRLLQHRCNLIFYSFFYKGIY